MTANRASCRWARTTSFIAPSDFPELASESTSDPIERLEDGDDDEGCASAVGPPSRDAGASPMPHPSRPSPPRRTPLARVAVNFEPDSPLGLARALPDTNSPPPSLPLAGRPPPRAFSERRFRRHRVRQRGARQRYRPGGDERAGRWHRRAGLRAQVGGARALRRPPRPARRHGRGGSRPRDCPGRRARPSRHDGSRARGDRRAPSHGERQDPPAGEHHAHGGRAPSRRPFPEALAATERDHARRRIRRRRLRLRRRPRQGGEDARRRARGGPRGRGRSRGRQRRGPGREMARVRGAGRSRARQSRARRGHVGEESGGGWRGAAGVP